MGPSCRITVSEYQVAKPWAVMECKFEGWQRNPGRVELPAHAAKELQAVRSTFRKEHPGNHFARASDMHWLGGENLWMTVSDAKATKTAGQPIVTGQAVKLGWVEVALQKAYSYLYGAALLLKLDSEDRKVRAEAAEALSWSLTSHPDVISALIRSMRQDASTHVRWNALRCWHWATRLKAVSMKDRERIERAMIDAALTDPSERVRFGAFEALRSVGGMMAIMRFHEERVRPPAHDYDALTLYAETEKRVDWTLNAIEDRMTREATSAGDTSKTAHVDK
jgi:hypothetical protein